MLKLWQGDCLELMKRIPDGSIDMVLTDPPYKISTSGAGIYNQKDRPYVKEITKMNDGFSPEVLDELCRVMRKINIYFFCSQKQIIPLLDYFVKKKKCNWNILSWHKTNPIPVCGNKYLSDTEFILFFREKGVKIYGNFDTKKTWYATQTNTSDKKKYGHPTCKPVGIIENLILNSSKEGEIILDPFMGSGSTGVACINTDRDFIGIEINEKYFHIAEQRTDEAHKEMDMAKNSDGAIKYKIERMHQMFGKDTEHICRECSNFTRYQVTERKVSKCKVYGDTASTSSDWNGRYTACGLFNKPYNGQNVIEMRSPGEGRDASLPDQISFFSAESEN